MLSEPKIGLRDRFSHLAFSGISQFKPQLELESGLIRCSANELRSAIEQR